MIVLKFEIYCENWWINENYLVDEMMKKELCERSLFHIAVNCVEIWAAAKENVC